MWPFGKRNKTATGQPHHGAGSGWRTIVEPYAGAWQKNDSLSMPEATSYPALFAAINRIASDIGVLDFRVMAANSDGVDREVPNSPAAKLLSKPNTFQSAIQFRRAWMTSLLTTGNTIVLNTGSELFVLDYDRVQPLVSDNGSVFYKISAPKQSLLPQYYNGQDVTVPASSIIHDRQSCFHHQLIGIPPVSAALLAASKNTNITRAANDQFANGGTLGGIISAPAGINSEQAKAIRDEWNRLDKHSVRVLGMDARFTPMVGKAVDAQAVEQLQYGDRQIAQCFGVPTHLLGIESFPSGLRPSQVMSMYFRVTLMPHVAAMEELLTQGLNLPTGHHVKLDTDQLLRLDTQARGAYLDTMTSAGIMTINEARSELDLPPVDGGDTPYKQRQDIPLDEAARGSRDE